MKKEIFYFVCLLFVFQCTGTSQNNFRVMFYNVENLFDTIKEPKKNDSDFLPDGSKHWTRKRYYEKLNNLAKVITAAGEWDSPALIGMCEVENDRVVRDLTQNTSLKNREYRFLITESPDERGIDVALLYQRDRFKYLHHNEYRIRFPYNPNKRTRNILHATGEVQSGDTLDVFVCHFPSRRDGEAKSEIDRVYVASVVRSKADSLMKIRKNANILIMGDFNDEPFNKSIRETLSALPYQGEADKSQLYNLFNKQKKKGEKESGKDKLSKILSSPKDTKPKGSYKYRGDWNILDQIIVSGSLLDSTRAFHVVPESATVFRFDFMMTEDKSQGGERPKKTYNGMRYEGGYSDHLPVIVDFSK